MFNIVCSDNFAGKNPAIFGIGSNNSKKYQLIKKLLYFW
jgi:hypothetical protein